MQVSVLLKGRLRGMGREAPCEVMAKRQAPGGKGREGYSDLRLLDAPADLPDGDYVLHLDPIMVSVRRRSGEWLMGNELLKEHKMSQPPTSPTIKA
jgi:hypothetical protein